MKTPSRLRRWLTATTCAAAALLAATAATAQSQTDQVDPTAWGWRNLNTPTGINDFVSDGYRMVDIEPEQSSSGLRYSGAFVQNQGAYQRGWWWYRGQTEAEVTSRLGQHGARLIDVEPYETSNGIRYAIVLIPNSGSDFASSHGWQTEHTFNSLVSWRSANPGRRILDIQPYLSNGSQRYAFAWVSNSGNTQSSSWLYLNTTISFIQERLSDNNARLIDLEHHDGTDRVSCIMVPQDGNAWWWYYGQTSSEISRIAFQNASRMIDVERYETSSGAIRYSAVMRRNDNDLTMDANIAMRSRVPLSSSSGLLLRRVGSGTATVASNRESETFEPASLMKTVHHFVACDQVRLGLDSFSNNVTEFSGSNGSCPTGSNPASRQLRNVLRSMMEQSSNTATEAIRARYGTAYLEARAAAYGAEGVELNHTIGCLCSSTRNEVRLVDLWALHDEAASGTLGSATDDFYDLMSNGQNFGMGVFNTQTILNDELASSSLTTEEIQSFRSTLRFAFKGGSYSCTSSTSSERHRSRGGFMSLPFRSGCDTVQRDYFLGAWVNDATESTSANDAVGAGIATLFTDRIRAAIDSWESASCTPFALYCTAVPNSTGLQGLCVPNGSAYVISNDITIRGTRVPANVFGTLLWSNATGFTPMVGGGAGNLCLGSTITRILPSVSSSGPGGQLDYRLNLNALPTAFGGLREILPGDTIYLQWWFRDLDNTGFPTSNLTQGLRASFI